MLALRPATLEDRLPLYRMLELYQHDLSDLWDQDLDAHGEYGYPLDRYWQQDGAVPYVFSVDGRWAGAALVDRDVPLPGGEHWLAQFFVLKKYRRRGLGRRVACQVFDRHPGRWQVGQMPGNAVAQAFWRRVVGDYSGGRYDEHRLTEGAWQGTLQCFCSPGTVNAHADVGQRA